MKLNWLAGLCFCFLLSLTSGALAQEAGDSKPAPVSASTKTASDVVQYDEDRHANFIFLVDVSGSIVSPRTNVKAADGSTITLFEALRDALKNIVADSRLISQKSKISFITFGTAITEKSDWPTSIESEKDRSLLLQQIASPTELQADKHGDTYMAGALDEAYKKAVQFQEGEQECTTTFIIMLTDGWDEPPPGASLNIGSVSAQLVEKQNELKKKLGVNTWQVRVVGLQRLPDKKAGTKTAAEVAKMLGGQFLDVTRSQGGTVAQQVYSALSRTIEELKGKIEVTAWDKPGGIVDFGTIKDAANLSGSAPLTNKSCYVEKITGVTECSAKVRSTELAKCKQIIAAACDHGELTGLPEHGKTLTPLASIAKDAITVHLANPTVLVAPVDRTGMNDESPNALRYRKADLVATVSSRCPPGSYLGFVQFTSTAKSPGIVPFVITVPSRYFVDPINKASMRKEGFLFNKPGSLELSVEAGAKVQSNYAMDFNMTFKPSAPSAKGGDFTMPSSAVNHGEPIKLTVNSGAEKASQAKFTVDVAPDTRPGAYEGKFDITCEGPGSISGPTSITYRFDVLPSPWDEMGPLAIGVLGILVLVSIVGIFVMIASARR